MNEVETRANLIGPKLKACGWGIVVGSIASYLGSTIVRQLDALRAETQKLEAVYQKKIVDLEELKKSIWQKEFAVSCLNHRLLQIK